MGPEDKNTCILYLGDVPIALGELPEITTTAPTDTSKLEITHLWQPIEFTVHIKTPKRWRCGSRKRFVKLMMSEGMGRKYAEWLAEFTREMMPYGEAWGNYLLHKFWRS